MAKTLAYGILYCLKAPEVMQKVRTNIHVTFSGSSYCALRK
jgi:hypothetical protein